MDSKHWFARICGSLLMAVLGAILFNAIRGPYTNSGFAEIVDRFFSVILTYELYVNLSETIMRFGAGYLIAIALGTALGISMGRSLQIERIFSIPVHILRPIPSAAIIPLAIVLFKSSTGDLMKISIVIYGVFWPVLLQVMQGCKDIDTLLIESGKTLGKSKKQIFIGIILPATTPSIMTGARIGLAIGLLLTVTTEMIAPGKSIGLGYLIIDFERSFKYPEMLAVITIVGLLGWIFDLCFRIIEKKLLHWHHGRKELRDAIIS